MTHRRQRSDKIHGKGVGETATSNEIVHQTRFFVSYEISIDSLCFMKSSCQLFSRQLVLCISYPNSAAFASHPLLPFTRSLHGKKEDHDHRCRCRSKGRRRHGIARVKQSSRR